MLFEAIVIVVIISVFTTHTEMSLSGLNGILFHRGVGLSNLRVHLTDLRPDGFLINCDVANTFLSTMRLSARHSIEGASDHGDLALAPAEDNIVDRETYHMMDVSV